jgi:hypothetical protein
MKKITQRELIVRYLAARIGEWTPSYDLVKRETEHGYIGLQGDRRAQELAEDGYFNSTYYRYTIERRRNGKYAEYRVSKKEKRLYVGGLRDYTFA